MRALPCHSSMLLENLHKTSSNLFIVQASFSNTVWFLHFQTHSKTSAPYNKNLLLCSSSELGIQGGQIGYPSIDLEKKPELHQF